MAHINIQAQMVELIRSVLVVWLPRSQLARDLLGRLPNMNPQVRAPCARALCACR